jgi:hypothetical protein
MEGVLDDSERHSRLASVQRVGARWFKLIRADPHGEFPRLRCPAGHSFHDSDLIWNDGALRCLHKGKDGRNDCNAMVVLLGGGLSYLGLPAVLIVEIVISELRVMRKHRMDWGRMVRYLGLTFEEPEDFHDATKEA